jgi:hypothetical protein
MFAGSDLTFGKSSQDKSLPMAFKISICASITRISGKLLAGRMSYPKKEVWLIDIPAK